MARKLSAIWATINLPSCIVSFHPLPRTSSWHNSELVNHRDTFALTYSPLHRLQSQRFLCGPLACTPSEEDRHLLCPTPHTPAQIPSHSEPICIPDQTEHVFGSAEIRIGHFPNTNQKSWFSSLGHLTSHNLWNYVTVASTSRQVNVFFPVCLRISKSFHLKENSNPIQIYELKLLLTKRKTN